MAYLALIGSFILWGISPIYWKLLTNIDNLELGAYRILISAIALFIFIKPSSYGDIYQQFLNYKKPILISCLCMFTNIFLFVYAVNTGKILQASFGYFLSPLLSIALGGIVLKEEISKVKLIAIVITLISLVIRLTDFDTFPWISLLIGGAFSLYGLLKKFIHIETKQMTFLEMTLISIPSLFILIYLSSTNEQGLMALATKQDYIILLFAWIPTVFPFLLFNLGTKSIPLNIVGFFQYLSPSIQFLVGLLIYKEQIVSTQWISFLLIWCACGMVAMNNFKRGTNARK